MSEHFELVQASKSQLLGAKFSDDGPTIVNTKWFLEIQAAEVKFERWISEPQRIAEVTWRGCRVVRKETSSAHREFAVLKRVNFHPNIVDGFGELCDGTESSAYFMEYMPTELFSLINDRVTRVVGENEPPFSHLDSIDILLQLANGVRHMHGQGVVHCDLKPDNVLMTEEALSANAKHFLVKVADFGSARYFEHSRTTSSGFEAGGTTLRYAAPEALQQIDQCKLQRQPQGEQQRSNEPFCIRYPDRIDTFSFGIVAFEVLTGDTNHLRMQFPDPEDDLEKRCESRKGVIEGTLRPPLRSKCLDNKKFIQDDELMSLVERCWHSSPSERPSFVEICEELKNAKVRILEKTSRSYLCGIDNLFRSSGMLIVTVVLCMLAFMCLFY